MEITWKDLKSLADRIDNASATATYSGRGMYGATCAAINLDSTGDLVALGIAATAVLDEPEVLASPSIDSMGYGIVAYWRNIEVIEVPEGLDEDEDEEDEDW